MSEHIQNLESSLNCKLFDRLSRKILPTPEAELLYPRALAILEDINKLKEEITDSQSSVHGELLLGASTIPGTYILPGLAANFKNKYPDISFEIRINDSSQIVEAVIKNELLMGFVGAELPTKKVQFTPFAEDRLVLAGASKQKIRAPLSAKELQELPFIIREKGSGTRKSTERLLTDNRINPNALNICATLGSSAAVKEALKANLGVSIISRHAIAEELENKTLQEIQVDDLAMKRFFYIVTATKRSLPARYRKFIESIRST